jgi:6-pyruvoyltetrahydropterin/6-carboxytetrahydropterin synthase
MYELTIDTHFSSAHNLREYGGACERLHGHNWKVSVTVEAGELDRLGMVVDFKALKEKTEKVVGRLDHQYLNEIPPFKEKKEKNKKNGKNPTAENLAEFIFGELKKALEDGNVRLKRVKVWESEKAAAAYYE